MMKTYRGALRRILQKLAAKTSDGRERRERSDCRFRTQSQRKQDAMETWTVKRQKITLLRAHIAYITIIGDGGRPSGCRLSSFARAICRDSRCGSARCLQKSGGCRSRVGELLNPKFSSASKECHGEGNSKLSQSVTARKHVFSILTGLGNRRSSRY